MKALDHVSGLAIVVLITLLVIVGCQSAPKEQPTVAPTVTPTEIVVAEVEANCPLEDCEDIEEPAYEGQDPELGDVYRAFITKCNFTCPEPYLKGTSTAIHDYYTENNEVILTGYHEFVTDDDGVWKGICKVKFGQKKPNYCIWEGDGKFKGLKMYLEYNLSNGDAKYRVTKLEE